MGRPNDIVEKVAGAVRIRHVLLRQGLAECLGTLILVVSMFVLYVLTVLRQRIGDTYYWVKNV